MISWAVFILCDFPQMDLFYAEGKRQTYSLKELVVTIFPLPSKCST